MLLALTLWVSSALPVVEVPRPGVALKDAAVQVLLVDAEHPDVSIDPGGGQKALKAARGMLLLKTDRIVVGPGAWVALAILANEQVVRLDDDLSLLVGELALLNAPKQSRTPVQQLDLLLTKKENDRTERLIGWHASQTAANTQPVQKEKSDTSGGGVSKSTLVREERSEKSKMDEETVAPKPSAPPAQPPPPPAPPPAPPPPPGSAQAPRKRTEPSPGSARGGPVGIDPRLRACVDLAIAGWGEGVKAKLGGALIVSAKLRDEEVIVSLPWGLPPDPCFSVYFQQQGGLSASWTRVTVPLK